MTLLNPTRLLTLAALSGMVLFAPAAYAQEQEAAEETATEQETPADVLTFLRAQGNFTVLVNALEQTGMAETLAGSPGFTLFAPTDEAFAALPEGTLENLGDGGIAGLLRLHVVEGTTLGGVQPSSTIDTLGGETLSLSGQEEGPVQVNGATVITADQAVANGVVHIIDRVILPTEGTPEEGR